MNIKKEKIPKGFSYALKSSMIVEAFEENSISTDTSLNYYHSSIFFHAHYWLPNQNVDYCRFYICASSIKSDKRQEALRYLSSCVIPEFIVWAKESISLSDRSTKLLKEIYFRKDFT